MAPKVSDGSDREFTKKNRFYGLHESIKSSVSFSGVLLGFLMYRANIEEDHPSQLSQLALLIPLTLLTLFLFQAIGIFFVKMSVLILDLTLLPCSLQMCIISDVVRVLSSVSMIILTINDFLR